MKWREWLREKTRSKRGTYTRGWTSSCGLFSVYKRESGKWSVWQREPTIMVIGGFDSIEMAQSWCDLHLKGAPKATQSWARVSFNLKEYNR